MWHVFLFVLHFDGQVSAIIQPYVRCCCECVVIHLLYMSCYGQLGIQKCSYVMWISSVEKFHLCSGASPIATLPFQPWKNVYFLEILGSQIFHSYSFCTLLTCRKRVNFTPIAKIFLRIQFAGKEPTSFPKFSIRASCHCPCVGVSVVCALQDIPICFTVNLSTYQGVGRY